ncbi:hypothetical protein AUL39_00630 [Tractidigestivibacter scatoligenes]|uniref:Uncharacterized protein n=1 Tax=Tractidigestivibacter scatoligenes TaxID=1299998 RepID=A0A124EGX8_TRASO|nr:hypothetical protein AUL39_00630 [Tractidigestivibacter scatoligenes]
MQEIFHETKRPYQPTDNFLPDAMIFQPVFYVESQLSTMFHPLLKTFVHIEIRVKVFIQGSNEVEKSELVKRIKR